jgi:hypothetical protein
VIVYLAKFDDGTWHPEWTVNPEVAKHWEVFFASRGAKIICAFTQGFCPEEIDQ